MKRLVPIAALLLSCTDPATPEPTSSASASSGGELAAAGPAGVRMREEHEIPRAPKPWEEMSQDEKGRFMAEAVVPYMRELFREYDPEAYASFGCASCHGPDMSARAFAMPSTSLLPLHPSGSAEQQAMVEAHPRMVRFMFNHAVPAMRTMLGRTQYDATSGQGFSCYTCHPHAE